MTSFEAAGNAQRLALEGQRQIALAIADAVKTALLRLARMTTRRAPAGTAL